MPFIESPPRVGFFFMCPNSIRSGLVSLCTIFHNMYIYVFSMYIYKLSDNYPNCQLYTFAGESRKIYPAKSKESRWDFSRKVESLSESRNRKLQDFFQKSLESRIGNSRKSRWIVEKSKVAKIFTR